MVAKLNGRSDDLGRNPSPAGAVSKQSECKPGPLKPRGWANSPWSLLSDVTKVSQFSLWQGLRLVLFLVCLTVAGKAARAEPRSECSEISQKEPLFYDYSGRHNEPDL